LVEAMSRQQPRPRRVVVVPRIQFNQTEWPDEASDVDPSYFPDDDSDSDSSEEMSSSGSVTSDIAGVLDDLFLDSADDTDDGSEIESR